MLIRYVILKIFLLNIRKLESNGSNIIIYKQFKFALNKIKSRFQSNQNQWSDSHSKYLSKSASMTNDQSVTFMQKI